MAMSHWKLLAFLCVGGCLIPAAASSQEVEFNRDIRPILSDKCFPCHGPDATNRKTKLRFDLESGYAITLRDGKPAVVPGDPEKSEVYQRISSENKAFRMPPAYMGRDRLKDGEIALVKEWIAQGAKWRPFWSFVPPKRPPPPAVHERSWVRNPID